METNYTYIDAFNELQRIVSEIETGETNIDELTEKIQRASELITICKAKLMASEAEVEKLLSKLTMEEEKADEEEFTNSDEEE
ncbi:exodeoxyribonuclease VII small subunit [Sphingobacterium wenxiniae]|uniref:Exodeoxyribonuclease VII small subunit n=1 Tax=Sphingobacterium wenxiniae TaxID=683125 RepID=A0A1I6UKM1_9SPHI|nr:exodeoxyribonuclease VII small subunit [Sphingobacterium wenxiniae]SFT01992.1 Exodeoxyribonuclease VII small subunit [Sphingobacterium wenxiniae]